MSTPGQRGWPRDRVFPESGLREFRGFREFPPDSESQVFPVFPESRLFPEFEELPESHTSSCRRPAIQRMYRRL
jgi:hypothetical protein